MFSILYVVSTLERTGPTAQLLNLVKFMDRTMFLPLIITLSEEPEKSYLDDFLNLGIEVNSLSLSRFKSFFLSLAELRKFVINRNIALVHSSGVRADFYCSRLKEPIPFITTVHNYPQIDYKMSYGVILGALLSYIQCSAFRKADINVACSNSVANNLINKCQVAATEVIRNGVDMDNYFKVSTEQKLKLRRVLCLPTDSNLWIVSGGLISRKDPMFILDYWLSAFANNDKHHLVVLGDGVLKSDCARALEGTSNIHLLGNVSNVSDYLKAGDYFISASKAEGFPMAVLEAIACGLSALLSDIEPHMEIVELCDEMIATSYIRGCQSSFDLGVNAILSLKHTMRDVSSHSKQNAVISAKKMSDSYQALYTRLIGAVI